jgi:hypothetical protein
MEDHRIKNPTPHLNTISDVKEIGDIPFKEEESTFHVTNIFWAPNQDILRAVIDWCKLLEAKNILEVGPGYVPFPLATRFIDVKPDPKNILVDVDRECLPHPDKYFDFIYARHVLEDLQNPDFALAEFARSSPSGYMETPSPLVEIIRGIDGAYPLSLYYSGYIHHRYFVWSNIKTNTIWFLPKMPIVQLIELNEDVRKRLTYLLNHYPIYWNNYFIFKDGVKPNIVIYKHSVNYDIFKDTFNMIMNGIIESINNTNYFIDTFVK